MIEPDFKIQLDEFGRQEKIDISKYNISVLCIETGCAQIRYVKNQDKFQSKYCKPHARKYRLILRAQRARTRRASRNNRQTPDTK